MLATKPHESRGRINASSGPDFLVHPAHQIFKILNFYLFSSVPDPIRKFMSLADPDPLVRGTDPDP
jgi:hypothetical protein